jgi:hypothetical protein
MASRIPAFVQCEVGNQNRPLAFYRFESRGGHCLGGRHASNDDASGEGGCKKLFHQHTFTQLMTNMLSADIENERLPACLTPRRMVSISPGLENAYTAIG